ncbi:MAG TPA: DUF5683 domain-containing protein [Bacteroidales bacterium]|nr:DUF5683 domain-containing protein [Bacteroidales bacterium]
MVQFNEQHIFTFHRRILVLILLFSFMGAILYAQGEVRSPENDTTNKVEALSIQADTLSEEGSEPFIMPDTLEHSPRKAMIYALVLPGLGQAYNKKYFKIPVVYAVLGGIGYWIHYNTQAYRQSVEVYEADQTDRNEFFLRAWRRNLELSYISLAAGYALQVVDAYVDAHLFYWDVSPNLSLRLEPSTISAPVMNYGISCRVKFK